MSKTLKLKFHINDPSKIVLIEVKNCNKNKRELIQIKPRAPDESRLLNNINQFIAIKVVTNDSVFGGLSFDYFLIDLINLNYAELDINVIAVQIISPKVDIATPGRITHIGEVSQSVWDAQ